MGKTIHKFEITSQTIDGAGDNNNILFRLGEAQIALSATVPLLLFYRTYYSC